MAELTTTERADRDALVARWKKRQEGFQDGAAILAELRHRRLYKDTHSTFAAYCVECLGFTASHVNNLVAVGSFKAILKSLAGPEIVIEEGDIVVPHGIEFRNAHRAEIARLPAPQRQGVLDRAVEIAEKAMPADAAAPRLMAKIIKEAAALEPDTVTPELDIPEQAFIDRSLWVAVQSQLSAVKRELTKLAERTSAKFLPLDPLLSSLRDAHAALKHGIPYCWCVECDGGVEQREDCGTCKGLGFMSLTMFKQTPPELRDGVRLWNSETTK